MAPEHLGDKGEYVLKFTYIQFADDFIDLTD